MKMCNCCGQMKPVTEFYRKSNSRLYSMCKPCTRERVKHNSRLRNRKKAYVKSASSIVENTQKLIKLPYVPNEVVFQKYDGNERCIRCYLFDFPDACRSVKCKAEERDDGPGYYRAANITIHTFPEV